MERSRTSNVYLAEVPGVDNWWNVPGNDMKLIGMKSRYLPSLMYTYYFIFDSYAYTTFKCTTIGFILL